MSEEDIINIKNFKEIAAKIINQFNDFNSKHPEKDQLSLVDFISHTSNQHEILCSELWKLDRFMDIVVKIANDQQKLCSSMRLEYSE